MKGTTEYSADILTFTKKIEELKCEKQTEEIEQKIIYYEMKCKLAKLKLEYHLCVIAEAGYNVDYIDQEINEIKQKIKKYKEY